MGIIFALLTTLSWSIGIFPFTQAARRMGVNSLNHFRLFLAIFFLAASNLIFDRESFYKIFSSEYSYSWFWLGISGIIGMTIGDYFAFKMYAIIGARIGSVLTTLAPAAALLFGYILIDEKINAVGIAGMIITIVGVISISLGSKERGNIPDHGHGSISKGVITGILGAVCQGAGLVLSKKGMLHGQLFVSALPATFIRITIGFFSLFILTLILRKQKEVFAPVLSNQNNGIKYAVMGTIFGPFMGVTLSLFTIQHIDVSVAQTIFSLVPVFALFIAFLFFKEKITLQSLIGVLVAITGVLVLIWREYLQQKIM